MSTWLYHAVINKVINKLISWFINKCKNDDDRFISHTYHTFKYWTKNNITMKGDASKWL